MAEDPTLKTHDQFLVEHGIIPNPSLESKINSEKLIRVTKKAIRTSAYATLALAYAAGVVQEIDRQEKLTERIKFAGLGLYARLHNLDLSATFIDHFLDGNGEPLDITDQFVKELKEQGQQEHPYPQAMDISPEMDSGQVIETYLRNAFELNVSGADSSDKQLFIRTLDVNGEEIFHTPGDLPNLVGQEVRVFRVDELYGDDAFYSIGNFTISAEGTLVGVDEQGNATFENARFSLFDRYDWKRGMGVGAESTVHDAIKGTVLEDIVPTQINNINLSVSDDDGATLSEAGIAHPFDVTASFTFDRPITIPVQAAELPTLEQLNP